MISEEWRSELLSKINIADIIGEYVTLVNKSGRLWACCPFHNEKTPSFAINTDKQFYHCFGCGKGGNVINFVMEMEKLSYPEACQHLAEKAGMEMPRMEDSTDYEKRKQEKRRTLEMNKIAAKYFHDNLFLPQGTGAKEYLFARGINERYIKIFGMGYAPDSWDGLLLFLEKKGFSKNEINKAGLCKIKDGKCYDMFRNRIMIPIINQFSEVIGFGGRVMDGSEPKYLNSPETPAFNKGKNLYNLNLSKKERSSEFLVLVEGYMDAAALYMYGIKNVVATLGTALTPEQARLICRYAKKVIVSYDGDGAGIKAAMRAIDILENAGIEAFVITIPNNMDPDEFLKKYGKDGYLKLCSSAKPSIAYKFNTLAKKYNINDGYEKERFAKECANILKTVKSAIEKEKYVRKLSEVTGFSENSIYLEMGEQKEENVVSIEETVRREQQIKAPMSEKFLVLKLSKEPEEIKRIEKLVFPEDFLCETYKKIFLAINSCVNKGFLVSDAEILSVLQNEEDRNAATELFCSEDQYPANSLHSDKFFADCIKDIKIRSLERKKDELIKKREESNNEEEKEKLLSEINGLIISLKDIKKIRISR